LDDFAFFVEKTWHHCFFPSFGSITNSLYGHNLYDVMLLLISLPCVFTLELKENDLEDSRKCEALVDVDDSGPEVLA
jgi:hypothetical protein